MSETHIRTATITDSLRRLRLRLTAWYVGTLLVILALIGFGLFAVITRGFDADLDDSLRAAVRAWTELARTRGPEVAAAHILIPERRLLLFDSAGASLNTTSVDPWLRRFAEQAAAEPRVTSHLAMSERVYRAYGEPVAIGGKRFTVVIVADEVELEDKYAGLIAAFAIAALGAVVLVAIGGWIVAGQSTAPVERAVIHMRRFMADAAHELRTPLSVVRSRAEVALQQPRGAAEYEKTLRAIEAESTRIGRIVEDLLTLARADTGERAIERQRVFLDDVALDAAEAAHALAERRGVRLEVEEFEEAPIVGDAALLRQLVLILLDNAIKFSPPSSRVAIRVRREPDAAILIVEDSGIGIAREDLPHVFERFYRADASRRRAGTATSEGAGLGLSIAQWVAEEHGATIDVRSGVGEGTRVFVRFPPVAGVVSSS